MLQKSRQKDCEKGYAEQEEEQVGDGLGRRPLQPPWWPASSLGSFQVGALEGG